MVIILYHAPCTDGLTAAMIAEEYYQNTGEHYVLHGTSPNELDLINSIKYLSLTYPSVTQILSFDVAFTQSSFDLLISKFPQSEIYDHHDSSLLIKPHPQLIVDLTRCGAHLSWDYFNSGKPVPLFVQYVENRDTWHFTLPNSSAVSKYLYSTLNNPSNCNDLIKYYLKTDEWLQKATTEGILMENFENDIIKTLSFKKTSHVDSNNLTFCAIESSIFISDLGNYLANDKNTSYAMIWRIDVKKNKVYVSMRSGYHEKSADLVPIAKKYNGGGHKHACGFETDPITFITYLQSTII